MKTSSFRRYDLHHLCKLSSDGSIIFYSNSDFLVFITIVFAYARRYGIRVTGLCIMFNHFHISVYAPSKMALTKFYQQISGEFVKLYNMREGKVKISFKHRSNISGKYGNKQKKTLLIYICNNPVEKKYCSTAKDYFWNFFKTPSYVSIADKSSELILAKAIVKDTHNADKPLKYEYFDHFENTLSTEEMADLIQYILSVYVEIDDSETRELFGSIEALYQISKSFYGADYDIKEDLTAENYGHYRELERLIRKRGLCGNDAVITQERALQQTIVREAAHMSNASNVEISRYFHIPLEDVQDMTGRRY